MSALPTLVVEKPSALRVSNEYLASRLAWPPGSHAERAQPKGTMQPRDFRHFTPEGLEQFARCLREGIRRARADLARRAA